MAQHHPNSPLFTPESLSPEIKQEEVEEEEYDNWLDGGDSDAESGVHPIPVIPLEVYEPGTFIHSKAQQLKILQQQFKVHKALVKLHCLQTRAQPTGSFLYNRNKESAAYAMARARIDAQNIVRVQQSLQEERLAKLAQRML